MAPGAMRVRHVDGRWGLPTTGVYCPTVTLVGHQVGQQKCPPLLVLSDLSDLSDLLKKTEHAALPQGGLAGSSCPAGSGSSSSDDIARSCPASSGGTAGRGYV